MLEGIEAFMANPAYSSFLSTIQADIDSTKEAIILTDRDDITCQQMRGEVRCLETQLKFFEEARVTLKTRIDEMSELELKHTTVEKENTNETK